MEVLARERTGVELFRSLQEPEFAELLRVSKRRAVALASFDDWGAVLTFLRSRKTALPNKAEVFGAILESYQAARDARWSAVLLAAYWVTLVSVHIQRAEWDDAPDELWHHIVTTFFESAVSADPADPRVLQNIYNEVLRLLRRKYRRQWRYERRHRLMAPLSMRLAVGAGPCADLEAVEHRDALNFAKQRLRCLVCNRMLTSEQAEVLFYTRVVGAGLAEYCRTCGLNFERERKRRLRVEASLARQDQNYFEKLA